MLATLSRHAKRIVIREPTSSNLGKMMRRKNRKRKVKITPIESIDVFFNNVTNARVPPLHHTLHRYPWLCSLRSVGKQSSHFCAVTLLSRPPGPTVLVTSAHCTFICKSDDGRLLPNCCCPNVGPDLCTDRQDCGSNAKTLEMTGADVEVLCGEWDTTNDTEEEYNVILPIKKIIRHPEFNISRGELNSQFVVSDVAVIKVEDSNFEAQSKTHKIYPACLPPQHQTSSSLVNQSFLHSGWSTAPPREYVEDSAPDYLQVYQQFSKQWHYNMTQVPCKDLDYDFLTFEDLKYPTNSYYPPGTVCASETFREFCPTSGESGSPLMSKVEESRVAAEGLLSFIKGCSRFDFRQFGAFGYNYTRLDQESGNPIVYTKLSCFLPWIAAQYDMDYTPSGNPDPACRTGNGDISQVTAEVCRSIQSQITILLPSNLYPITVYGRDELEAPCIFPFTVNGGETNNVCIMDAIQDFTRPVFRCPIRTIKGAGPNGTDYTDQHLIGGENLQGYFCPTNSIGTYLNESGEVDYLFNADGAVYGPNGQLQLDPDNSDCDGLIKPVFGTCNNNCPGGQFSVHNKPIQIFL